MKRFLQFFLMVLLTFSIIGCSNTSLEEETTPKDGKVLLGNLANATVNIYQLNADGLKTLLWNETTSNGTALEDIGNFNTHAQKINPSIFYLFEVKGGEDWDVDDDGIKDQTSTPNKGTFHAIVKGDSLVSLSNEQAFTVTYLSEILYQAVKENIGQDDFETVYVDEAKKLLSNTNSENITLSDLAQKINSYFPAKKNVELNATIEEKKQTIAQEILNGNKYEFNEASFSSATLVNPNNISQDSVVEILLNLSVSYSYGNIPVTVSLINTSDNSSVELEGSTITNLNENIKTYIVETAIDNNISDGTYKIEIALPSKDNTTIKHTTNEFKISKAKLATINGLSFDSDENENTTANQAAPRKSSTPSAKTIEMNYDKNGLSINSTLEIENKFQDKNISNIMLKGYLQVSDEKIEVPFAQIVQGDRQDNQKVDLNKTSSQVYTNSILIPTIEANTILNISTDILISRESLIELLKKLGTQVLLTKENVLNSFAILELEDEDHNIIDSFKYPVNFFMSDLLLEVLYDNAEKLANGSITVEELLASLEATPNNVKRASASTSASASATTNSKNQLILDADFSKQKFGKRLGAGIYAKGHAILDENGIHSATSSVVKLKILKKRKRYTPLYVSFTADVDPGSFEDTGYNFVVKSFGKNLYTRSKSLADITDFTIPSVDDIKDPSLAKATKYAKANALILASKAANLVSYKKEKDFGKVLSKTRTIVAGFIPVVVEVGAKATVGYVADIHLDGITALEASFTPNARVGAWIDGGVGAGFDFFGLDIDYSAGVGGSFWMVSDDFKNSVTASIDLVENETHAYVKYIEGNLNENITNYYYGPHGRFYLYGKWYGPRYKSQFYQPWNWSKHKKTKTLAKWSTTSNTTELLDKNQNLFRVTLVPDLGINYPDMQRPSAPAVHKNILFAHGLNSSTATWNDYTKFAKKAGWTVYQTNVEKLGSIKTRATELANYINNLELDENSLVVVGHSMGGLDLRYIVSYANTSGEEPFVSAAKTITKIYTIATPHGGNQFAGFDNADAPALKDLGIDQMASFNKKYPYTTLSIEGRKIPFLAIRSICDNPAAFGSDGVVSIFRQSLDGAPYNFIPFISKHTEKAGTCSADIPTETENTEILRRILENGIATDNYMDFNTSHRDIVLYDEKSCKGEVVAKFNSNYEVDIDCSESDDCINNKASSMMLYPNVKKGTAIRLYDHPDKKTSTRNYFSLYRGSQDWDEPVCITGFQHSTSPKEEGYGIKTIYNKKQSSKSLNGEISHIRVWQKED